MCCSARVEGAFFVGIGGTTKFSRGDCVGDCWATFRACVFFAFMSGLPFAYATVGVCRVCVVMQIPTPRRKSVPINSRLNVLFAPFDVWPDRTEHGHLQRTGVSDFPSRNKCG